MDISILPCAARGGGVGDIGDVDEYDASSAGVIAGDRANGEYEVGFVVGEDVVCSADGEFIIVTSEILLVGENLRGGWINGNELYSNQH